MAIRRFALIYGIVFLLVGAAGLVPGLTVPHEHPDVHVTSGLGLELGLFPVNLHATFGLIPMYGHDVWLHAALGLVAGYFGFVHKDRNHCGSGSGCQP